MPLTAKGRAILNAMQNQYGEKKGESVFYASKNAGTISGVDAERRARYHRALDRVLDWNESEHPRAEGGEFTSGGGSSKGGAKEKLPGTRAVAQRMANAHTDMIETLMSRGGISREDAEKALTTLRKVKAIKLNPASGKYDVTHGGFMEPDVIRRAINYKQSK